MNRQDASHSGGSIIEGLSGAVPVRMPPDLYSDLASFRKPDGRKAAWQLVNTLAPYAFLWYLMVRSIQLDYPYVVTLLVALPAAAFLVRVFILFHDCAHNSLFPSRKANVFFGYLLGVLVFTSYEDWRNSHLRHHATYANLDERGFGDIWTMTLAEYRNSSTRERLKYRLYRNPVVLIVLGAVFLFLLSNRLPGRNAEPRVRRGILLTNLLLGALVIAAALFIGLGTYLMIQLPVIWLAGMAGIWLFYVQHQFPDVYWRRRKDWDPWKAAMQGSSFYRLPTLLRWFSGSIGFHNIHHLNPVIPNYQLKNCYDYVPAMQCVKPLTILSSLTCVRLKLWDEEHQEMVGFPE